MKHLNRRRFLKGAATAASVFAAALQGGSASGATDEPDAQPVLFVGTQTGRGSRGIYAYQWDARAGALHPLGLAAETPMPTFLALAPDRQFLFAANETDTFAGQRSGGVSSFRILPGGKLVPVNSAASGGTGTCHVGVDRTGRTLLCANYGGGSASSFAVGKGGRVSPPVSHFQYSGAGPNKDRQEAPHVHRATASPSGRFALFNDLGLDRIHLYALDGATAKLSAHAPAEWQAPAGSGPRALVFHPNGRWAYCVAELKSAVLLLEWDERAGTLTMRQQLPLNNADFHGRSQASDAVLDRAGRFLYAADRYHDGLYTFAVDPASGELHELERTEIRGKVPRHLTLDPTEQWLLVANQESDTIEGFPRDPRTGKLAAKSTETSLSRPQCLIFV